MDSQVNQKGVKSGGSIFQRLVCKETAENSSSNDDKVPYSTSRRSVESTAYALFEEFTPNGVTGNALVNSEAYVSDHGSLLSLQPWIFRKGDCLRDDETMKANGECSIFYGQQRNGYMFNSQAEVSPQSISLGYKHGRARSSLRSRRHHRNSVKPLSSMENCLIPQLYNDNFEIENLVSTSFPSSTTSPFVITDGSEIISKLSYEPINLDFGSGIDMSSEKKLTGASPLPGLRTPKRKSRETPHKKIDSISTQRSKKLAHHEDSLARVHIFSVGVSLGIISTVLLKKNEIENLNGMLKSSENLVQDLQVELEMKDTITLEELTSEVSGLLKRCDNITKCKSIEPDANQVSASYCPAEKEKGNSLLKLAMEESRSKIEAELEIELEKLELSMNICSLNGRMPVLDELDPDLIADVVHGEIRADVLPGRASDEQSENASTSSTSTTEPQSFNCPVSPLELSLRLHEVIQLRLEERIQELERELQETQKQLQLSKSERFLSHKAFSSSDMGSSSNLDSPTSATGNTASAQLFSLNLTGDALDEHDEAYEEFMRVANTEEKQPSTANRKNEFGYCVHSCDRSSIGEAKKPEPLWEQKWKSKGSIDTLGILATDEDATDEDEYDSDDGSDDNEMNMLLKQILDRTKQGSPIVKDVQRLLFSVDD